MSKFKVGDKVKFTVIKNSGRGKVSMSTKEGVIEELGTERAMVKCRGTRHHVYLDRLRPVEQRSELTDFVTGKS
jgi:hypothetical protein